MKIIVVMLMLCSTAWANTKDVEFIQHINPKVSQSAAESISSYVNSYSSKYELDPNLVISLIAVESDFKVKAVSPKKAYGLMQVNHNSWKKDPGYRKIVSDKKQLVHPRINVEAGCFVLSELRKQDSNRYVSLYLGERNYEYLQKIKRYRKLHKTGNYG